jgi:hypothetical protein
MLALLLLLLLLLEYAVALSEATRGSTSAPAWKWLKIFEVESGESLENSSSRPPSEIVNTTESRALTTDCVYFRIAPRSGLAVKFGIDVLAGVVDSDYRGEIIVLLINHGTEVFLVCFC